MRNITKKMMISILTTIFVLITVVATTYAWVGIFTYSSANEFNLSLEAYDNNILYNLLISSDGIDFKDAVPASEIQSQIVRNMGVDLDEYLNDPTDEDSIATIFRSKSYLRPATPTLNTETNELGNFAEFDIIRNYKNKVIGCELIPSDDYFKFDFYLTVEPKDGGIQPTTSINANIYFNDIENTLVGNTSTGTLINPNPFLSLPSSDIYSVLSEIPNTFSILSSNSARFSLSIYNPIDINSSYTNETPIKTVIYQGGSQSPRKMSDGLYDLGGILPEEYNFAIKEVNELFGLSMNTDEVQEFRFNDLELKEENNLVWAKSSELWDENDNPLFLGVNNSIQTKIKITVHFWFEGWDADCMRFLDFTSTDLNLKFTTDKTDNN